jgi:hypothetical protein
VREPSRKRSAGGSCLPPGAGESGWSRGGAPGGDQADVRAAHARVLLASSSDALREAAEAALAAAVAVPDDPSYTAKRDVFIDLAQKEIDPDE